MTPAEAAAILEVAPDAKPEQIEARFLDLRTKLEEKIGKAPTPGLKDKYRRSLDDITKAFETLTLAADSSALPVLRRAAPPGETKPAPESKTAPASQDAARAPSPAPAKMKEKSNKEFALVALAAVVLLGGGGWFVMNSRAESARQESLVSGLRARLAEARAAWEGFPLEVQASERVLSELKSDSRNTDKLTAPQRAELLAQLAARQDYNTWLVPFVQRHPVKTLLAKLDAHLASKAADEASKAADELTSALADADKELASQKLALLATDTPLKLVTTPEGVAYTITDAWGRKRTGTTPDSPATPFGETKITFHRNGWPDQTRTLLLRRSQPAEVSAEFVYGSVEVMSTPSGAEIYSGERLIGTTPKTLTEAFPGELALLFKLKGYRPTQVSGTVVARQKLALAATLEEYPRPESGKAWTITEPELKMVWIAPGSFTMGSPASEPNRTGETEDQVSVTLSKGYWMGSTEVTQSQYESVMGANPSYFIGANLPVQNLSWEDAMAFCRRLTEREREAGRLPAGYRYTLPTEAQWEYACRAGTSGEFAGPSLDELGWHQANAGGKPHPVAGKRPNAWGLYDMHGNVYEWCADWYGWKLPGGYDPAGASTGSWRVGRGGSYYFDVQDTRPARAYCRSACRGGLSPEKCWPNLGFRLALISE